MKNGVWVFILAGLFFSGCNDALKSHVSQSGMNVVPDTFENPDLYDQDPNGSEDKPISPKPGGKPSGKPSEKPIETTKKPSRLMYYAQKIMETEGRKLGTACNFYVHRVLQAAGFVHDVYKANDFHLYPPKHFADYRDEKFVRSSSVDSEAARLRRYLWSYPERTPFIMNWRRPSAHGHIALVERIGEQLVIYQASLGSKLPRKDQTSVELLLKGNRKNLTVYSEMTPK